MNHMENLHFGSRESILRKSFKLAISSLLKSCSQEDFYKVFSAFDYVEREVLHQLFTRVITALHGNLEDEFDSICHEYQAGTVLSTVEQLVEEQSFDILSTDMTNIVDIKEELLRAKKDEILYLRTMLEKAEEKNRNIRADLESLKSRESDFSSTANAVEKLRSSNLGHQQISEQRDTSLI